MKANQKFKETVSGDDDAFVGLIIAILLAVLVASAVMGTIANESQDAEDLTATDDKTDTIIDLWPFLVAIGVLLYIVKMAV